MTTSEILHTYVPPNHPALTEGHWFFDTRQWCQCASMAQYIDGRWAFSDDFQKSARWKETLAWAAEYGGEQVIQELRDQDFYVTHELSRSDWLDWNYGSTLEPAVKPPESDLSCIIQRLRADWQTIAPEIADRTRPHSFIGAKAKSLHIEVLSPDLPPWGTWEWGFGSWRDQQYTDRHKFTEFRKAVNSALAPHSVDHVVF